MAFRPSSPFKRSLAQSGAFTVHGTDQRAIDEILAEGLKLERLIIPASQKKQIFLSLRDLNITRGFLFGDPDSIARSIRVRYSKDDQI